MTDTSTQESGGKARSSDDVPAHPHFTLGTIAVAGIAAALVATLLAVTALVIVASRNSVDDALVSDKVDALLSDVDLSGLGGGDSSTSVIPAMTPKADLAVASGVSATVAPNVPPPVTRSEQAIVEVHFEVVENVTTLDPTSGVQFETWGYRLVDGPDGVVIGTPGPMIRARVGDIFRFTITNPEGNLHPHNVDFHAVTGQGGGAANTTVAPGETRTIEARLLYPGFFLYHCAYGDVPSHISHGMYGGILVDPATPLPEVDHEWYVVQSEFYTTTEESGLLQEDRAAITNEQPRFVVFNGALGALSGDNTLAMNVGEKARIYFVNAGLNLISSFHPIGSHWDAVYPEAALLNPPIRGSQTTLVPAGGGTVVEIIGQVPSTIILVDHALARVFDKGALGTIVVSGSDQPEIFEEVTPGSGEPDEGGGEAAGDVTVEMLPGAGDPGELGSPDEFDENESHPDYSINVLEVTVGTTVTWTNTDPSMIHTATAVDGSFDTGFLNSGESFSFTFTEVGEFEYFCLPHPWMRAKVIVTE